MKTQSSRPHLGWLQWVISATEFPLGWTRASTGMTSQLDLPLPPSCFFPSIPQVLILKAPHQTSSIRRVLPMRWVSELGTGSHEETPYIPNHDEEPQTITGSKDAMQSGP